MVSAQHEAMHRVFQTDPGIFARATRTLDLPFPDPLAVELLSVDLTTIEPIERRVDTLLRILTAAGTFILAVEAQRSYDPDKSATWPYYVAYVHNKYELPVVLLVITDDVATARKIRTLPPIGHPFHPTLALHPIVLGPAELPVITDIATAAHDIPLAVLSAIAHADDPRIDEILTALAKAMKQIDSGDGDDFADLTELGLGDSPAGDLWRKIVSVEMFYRSKTAKQLWAAARDEGVAEGVANTLLRILDRRGIEVPGDIRARIVDTQDVDLLETWVDRAFTVTSAADLFVD
ncbi:hypothetical protein [Nocardia aurantia]|uniref:Uncharacterized protein n=1 Tax=Nocardia aurantia TaxID=2585199 RepID=A0A7K0DRG7_9NOCA|nr:hypothetical protein [Nocardia aurantia]MQY28349.1 hypothetical protein [Nocardia aurantia]